MADVFLTVAHGPQGVNKLAVVKRLRNKSDEALTEMFLDEARLAARLNHPNIVHTYEVGEAHDEYFIAMEYLEGQPLNRVLKTLDNRGDGLSEAFIAFIAIEVLKGLHHAHEFCDFDGTPLGVVHRDVSPHNLFVTYGGQIKLLDFGIAKAAMNVTHTEDGVLKGKVRYMAPEHAIGKDTDRRADIFAFGVILWEMLARRPLFTGAAVSILTRIVNEETPAVRDVRPDVSPALEAIALKATRRNREERYATAEEMRLDLERYLRGRSDVVSERDLARLMNELFATLRDEVRARIKAYIASMPTTLANAPGLTGTGKLPILFPSWNGPASSSGPTPSSTSASAYASRVVEEHSASASLPAAPTRRSRWPLWLFILLLVGAGLFVARSQLRLSRWLPAPIATALFSAPVSAPADSPPAPAEPPGLAPVESNATHVVRPPIQSTPSPPLSAANAPAALPAPSPHRGHGALPAAPAPPPASVAAAPAPAPSPSASERPKIRMLDDESESP